MAQLYQYSNYRDYLRDFYQFRKERKGSKFSYRLFSRLLGFSSPNSVKRIILGERNISKKSIGSVINGLKLDKQQTLYFKSLVEFTHGKTDQEKRKHLQVMKYLRACHEVGSLDEMYSNFLTTWYYLSIHEMTRMPSFKEDPKWIADRLNPKVTEEEVTTALELMKKLGLLKHDARNRLAPSQPKLKTVPEIPTEDIRSLHEKFIGLGLRSLNETPADQRDVSSLTIAVNQKSFLKTKKLIQDFRNNLNVLLSETEETDTVYQLNIQFFNLATVPWEGPCHGDLK